MLDERRLDFGLAMLAVPNANIVPGEYSVEIPVEDRLCVITSRRSSLACRRRIDISELSKLPWVMGPLNTPGYRGLWRCSAEKNKTRLQAGDAASGNANRDPLTSGAGLSKRTESIRFRDG